MGRTDPVPPTRGSKTRYSAQTDRTDEELVADFLNGDVTAFRVIVERHRARLMKVARSYAHNEHDAQDILQEAWLKASTNMDSFRAEAKLSTWLHTVVAHKGYDYKNHRFRKESAVLDEEETRIRFLSHLVVDPYEGIERGMVIRQALSMLPIHQREALVLVDMLGMSVRDAAEKLGVREGTVKSRRARARDSARDAVVGA